MSPAEGRARPQRRVSIPLVACLVVVLVLALLIFRFFVLTFTIAASVALLLAPLQRALTRRLGGWRTLAAGLLGVLLTLALVAPLFTLGTIIAQQAAGFVDWLRPNLEPAAFDKFWRETLPSRYPLIMAWVRRLTGGSSLSTASSVLSRLAPHGNHLAQASRCGRLLFVARLQRALPRRHRGQPPGAVVRDRAGQRAHGLRHLRPHAVLPAARRRRDPRGSARDLSAHAWPGAGDRHPPDPHRARRAAVDGAGAARPGRGRVRGLLDLRRALAAAVERDGRVRGAHPDPGLAPRLDPGRAVPPLPGRVGEGVRPARVRGRDHQRHRTRHQAAHPEGRGADPRAARVPVDPGRPARVRSQGLHRGAGRALARRLGLPHLSLRRAALAASRARRTRRRQPPARGDKRMRAWRLLRKSPRRALACLPYGGVLVFAAVEASRA